MGERALNAVEKLPAAGDNFRGRYGGSEVVLGFLCTAVKPGAEFQIFLLPLQTACCEPSAHNVLWIVEKLGECAEALQISKLERAGSEEQSRYHPSCEEAWSMF